MFTAELGTEQGPLKLHVCIMSAIPVQLKRLAVCLLSRPGGAHHAEESATVASADSEMADVLQVSWSIWPSIMAMTMSMPT